MTFQARKLNVFADTMIARVTRWLIDRGGTATQAEFMREYHRRGTRKGEGRSSFSNNVAPYTRGQGRALESYSQRDVLHSRDRRMVRYVGPDVDTMLRGMSVDKLDRAFAALECSLQDRPLHRLTDQEHIDETGRWLLRIRAEVTRRSLAFDIPQPPPCAAERNDHESDRYRSRVHPDGHVPPL